MKPAKKTVTEFLKAEANRMKPLSVKMSRVRTFWIPLLKMKKFPKGMGDIK